MIFVAAAAIWGLAQTRGSADGLYSDNLQTAQLTANLAQEMDDTFQTAQHALLVTSPSQRDALLDQLFTSLVPTVQLLLSELQLTHAHDPLQERSIVSRMVGSWDVFRRSWGSGGIPIGQAGPRSSAGMSARDTAAAAAALRAAFDPIEAETDALQAIEEHDARQAYERGRGAYDTSLLLIFVATGAGLLFGAAFVLYMSRRVLPRALMPERDQAEFAEAMQIASSIDEAHSLLKRHLERVMPASSALVLRRLAHSNQVEPATALEPGSAVEANLRASPELSCVAVRSSRAFRTDPTRESLIRCGICSAISGSSICTPVTAGGQATGAVLVTRERHLEPDDRRLITDSIHQAAPVLANLRTLAAAEWEATTDALTGLPNKRSVRENLTQMVAQAVRLDAPLAALSIDLDHFKQINDAYGHARGDEVLTAVGSVLRSTLRASDFGGRNGGEEFLVLLPATSREEALAFADRLLLGLRKIDLPDLPRGITASIGLSVFPDDALDGQQLALSADQALYAAKRNGRNRVEVAGEDVAPGVAADVLKPRRSSEPSVPDKQTQQI